MNPQFPAQYYPTNIPQQQLTAEQLKALKQQQDAFLEQQKKFLVQQQELQKQQMREEQRNRLKNMNVRTMGAPSNLASSQHCTSSGQYQPKHSVNNQHNQPSFHHKGFPPKHGYSEQQSFMPTQQSFSVSNQAGFPMQYNQMQPQIYQQPLGNSINQFNTPVQLSARLQPPALLIPQVQTLSPSSNSTTLLQPLSYQNLPQNTKQAHVPSTLSSNPDLLSDPQRSTDDDFGDFESVPITQPRQPFNNLVPQTIQPSSMNLSIFDQSVSSIISTCTSSITDSGDCSVNNNDDSVLEQKSEDDSFGDFAGFASLTLSNSTAIPDPDKGDSLFQKFEELQTPISNIFDLGPKLSKAEEEDDFGDFASSRGSTPRPPSDYIPGQLDLHEDISSPHSVEIYSNPVVPKLNAGSSKSEFDMLIEKSLSGKPAPLPAKSLFKQPAKKAVPSSQQTFKASKNSANWSSLDFGGMFESSAAKNISHDLAGLDLSTTADLSTANDYESPFFTASVTDEGDDFGDFTSETASNGTKKNDLSLNLKHHSSSPIHKSQSAPFFDVSSLVGIVTPSDESIFDVAEPVINNDWIVPGDSEEPMLVTTDNDLLSIVNQLTNPVNNPQKVHHNSKDIDHDKLPSIYKDIIKFCNTPSGIIDVSKVYEVMVTPKFKLVMLQPLMNQCNMSSGPTANDLVHLIGIVGLKQKGFPTPSKYELDYNRLPIPSINSTPMRNRNKSNESDKKAGTLLSFVNANKPSSPVVSQIIQPLQPSSDNNLKSVFDFDNSSGVDFLSQPIMKTDECVEPATVSVPLTQPYLGLPPVEKVPVVDFFNASDNDTSTDNDWGNFSTTSVFQESHNQHSPSLNLFSSTQNTNLYDSTPVPNLLDASPVVVSDDFTSFDLSKAFNTISSENNASKTVASRTSIPAAAMDEPPPLSDDDDDDWADFAHPAEKWAFDPDEIDESKITVNRWGGETKVSKPGQATLFVPDKYLNHLVPDAEPLEKPALQLSRDEILPSPDLEYSFEDFQDASSAAPPAPIDLFAEPSQTVSSSRDAVIDSTSNPPKGSILAVATPSKDTLLSSPETSHPLDDTFSPFDDFVESRPTKDELYWDDPTPISSNGTPAVEVFADEVPVCTAADFDTFVPFDEGKSQISEDEFADFQSTNDQVDKTSTFSPFDEFDDDEPEEEENPLALKNLPNKSLDGFWDEMVGTLETEKKEPTMELEVPQKPVMTQSETLFKEPPKYDALKEDTEDNSWNLCLSNGLTMLRQCEKLLRRAVNENVLHEVIKSSEGKQYILCCTEIYRVASRINISDTSDDCLVEIYKEIKHIWTLLGEILDDHYDLPTIHDFNISRNFEETVPERLCGVCLLDTGCENKSGVLSYNGRSYHAACANFWINTITPTLPNLNVPRMVEPLL